MAQRADAAGIAPKSSFSTDDGRTITPGKDYGGSNTDLFWFNPNAFAQPGVGRLGTSGRDIIPGPGFWNFDISVFKNFPITETMKVQCRAEFFDAFNTCGSIRRR